MTLAGAVVVVATKQRGREHDVEARLREGLGLPSPSLGGAVHPSDREALQHPNPHHRNPPSERLRQVERELDQRALRVEEAGGQKRTA